ncbi:MAG: LAGLIDADG family homing endonuclease [Candidatus Neomarinimicrobiota bacterium]|jgi:hypothetical protein
MLDVVPTAKAIILTEQERRHNQYLKKAKKREVKLKELYEKDTDIPTDFGNWLAGFADGEGHFQLGINRGRWSSIRFSIKLRADDKHILDTIQKTLGFGKVEYRKVSIKAKDRITGTKPQCVFAVYGKRQCWKLMKIFDSCPLRSKKKNDYEIWKKALLIMGYSYVHGSYDPKVIKHLEIELKKIRKYQEDNYAIV